MAGKSKISFIGSGNIATNLAYNLDLAGKVIYQVISNNLTNAKLLADVYGAFSSDKVSDLFYDADVLFICTPDDAIGNIAKEIPDTFSGIIAHCSGSVDLKTIEEYKSKVGVFYPLQSFSKADVVSMLSVPILVEGDLMKVETELDDLACAISNNVKRVNSTDRMHYHLAAVIANNFTNLMYVLSHNYLQEHKLDFKVLLPLIKQTANRLKGENPIDWQTGPAKRGDMTIVEKQLKMLNDSDIEEVYRLLSNYVMTKL